MVTPAQLSKWTRTLNAVLATVQGVELVQALVTEKDLEDETEDTIVLFKIKDGSEAYRLTRYREFRNDKGEKYPNPMWSIERWQNASPPDSNELLFLDCDIDFNISCVKLVQQIVTQRAYHALRCRQERPILSDDLRTYLESLATKQSLPITIGGILRLLKSLPTKFTGELRVRVIPELEDLIDRLGDIMLLEEIL